MYVPDPTEQQDAWMSSLKRGTGREGGGEEGLWGKDDTDTKFCMGLSHDSDGPWMPRGEQPKKKKKKQKAHLPSKKERIAKKKGTLPSCICICNAERIAHCGSSPQDRHCCHGQKWKDENRADLRRFSRARTAREGRSIR